MMNEECIRIQGKDKQQRRKDIYLAMRDRNPLHIHFKRFHRELFEILEEEYNWALDEPRPWLNSIKKEDERTEQ